MSDRVGATVAGSNNKDLIIEGKFTKEVTSNMTELENWKRKNKSISNKEAVNKTEYTDEDIIYFNKEELQTIALSLTLGGIYSDKILGENIFTTSLTFDIGILMYNEVAKLSNKEYSRYDKISQYGTRFSLGFGVRYYYNEINFLLRLSAGMFTKYNDGYAWDFFIDLLPSRETVIIGITGSFQTGKIDRSDGNIL